MIFLFQFLINFNQLKKVYLMNVLITPLNKKHNMINILIKGYILRKNILPSSNFILVFESIISLFLILNFPFNLFLCKTFLSFFSDAFLLLVTRLIAVLFC